MHGLSLSDQHAIDPVRPVECQLHLPDVYVAIKRECRGGRFVMMRALPKKHAGGAEHDDHEERNDYFSFHLASFFQTMGSRYPGYPNSALCLIWHMS